MIHARNCPNCDKELKYKSLMALKKAVKVNRFCRSCVMTGNKRGSGNFENTRHPKEDITDKTFNNWKVVKISHRKDGGMWYWDVECTNCGFKTKRSTNYVKESKGCICCGLLPKGDTGLNKVICNYRESAKLKNRIFELNKQTSIQRINILFMSLLWS